MKLTNQMYDVSKWIVLIFLPALAVFLGGLGEIYQWVNTSVLLTTLNLFTVFLGSLLQRSSQKYHQNDSYRGE